MTHRPTRLARAARLGGPYRAGGTELTRLRRLGLAEGEPVDLRELAPLRGIERTADGLRIGAMVTLRELAGHPEVRTHYPALAQGALAVANPQVRSLATVGGNVLQQTRCAYFTHPDTDCLRKGGTDCPARDGHHAEAAVFDVRSCVAPHSSTLATILACFGALAQVTGRGTLSLDELLHQETTGGVPRPVPHTLAPGELLTAFMLPAPRPGERSAYLRVSRRALADWPLVEVAVRCAGAARVECVRVVAGAVAPRPWRLRAVEEAVLAGPATPDALRRGAALATTGAHALPGTRYKLRQLEAAVLAALERCWPASQEVPAPAR
ncbi:hypothetical protein FCH28_31545 [Streptomyces piniterrae]|uniref:FAD-binding PCMH-type domain-containing protein n=1 Tax=Streptomyces piniterrae TaxID=2571125 RepID=A0A4U0MT99_9ACTN|nr:FAD binding domain-containing protein [Streptomyces piniterrae]TJZ44133.1 hypothetical protein FCH28_31545 [Streptomyces piniterrae]